MVFQTLIRSAYIFSTHIEQYKDGPHFAYCMNAQNVIIPLECIHNLLYKADLKER